jgi:hypothetical protein
MKISIAILCVCFLFVSSVGYCEEFTREKKDAINELMSITGAAQMGELFGNAFVQQLTNILKKTNPEIDPRALEILKKEVMALIHEEMVEKESLQKLIYPIYHKYLTLEEIRELVRFYKTPVGKKAISVMPKMAQEAMQAGQAWGQSLGPVIQQRVLARLEKEGIKINK